MVKWIVNFYEVDKKGGIFDEYLSTETFWGRILVVHILGNLIYYFIINQSVYRLVL